MLRTRGNLALASDQPDDNQPVSQGEHVVELLQAKPASLLATVRSTSSFWNMLALFSVVVFGYFLLSAEVILKIVDLDVISIAASLYVGNLGGSLAIALVMLGAMHFALKQSGHTDKMTGQSATAACTVVIAGIAMYILLHPISTLLLEGSWKWEPVIYAALVTFAVCAWRGLSTGISYWRERTVRPKVGFPLVFTSLVLGSGLALRYLLQ